MVWKFITFFVRKLDPENAHKITYKYRNGIKITFFNREEDVLYRQA